MSLMEYRANISMYVHSGDLDSLESLGFVSIVEQRNPEMDIANGFDCIYWVFKNSPITRNQWILYRKFGVIPENFMAISIPEDGDIVEYNVRKNGLFRPTHIGIFNGPTVQVVSKWGDAGHIFIHDLWAVPVEYGDYVSFYRYAPQLGDRDLLRRPAG